jgi:Na+/proline symporter
MKQLLKQEDEEKETYNQIFLRKMIAGLLTSTLFPILLGLWKPGGFFNSETDMRESFLNAFLTSTYIYSIYVVPIILLYGTATSMLSELLSIDLSKWTSAKMKVYFSALFHMIFGLVFFLSSITAALLFFFIDLYLANRNTKYSIRHLIFALFVPVGAGLLLVSALFIIN